MWLRYGLLFCLGGCIAYTYDYGSGTPYGMAHSRMGSPLMREEVPPAPNVYSGSRIYGLVPPASREPTVPPVAPSPPPVPAEPASGRSAAEGLKLLTPPQREDASRVGALSDSAVRELIVLGAERPPAMAFALSLGVGFGCGHYYAEDVSTARAILGGELVGLGMMVLGHLEREGNGGEMDDGGGMMELGALVFVGFRVYEVLTVTGAAKRYNQQLRARFGVGVVPTRGGAMIGAGWRY